MAGIAGIARRGASEMVQRMLEKIAHRGPAGSAITQGKNATLGVCWPHPQATAGTRLHASATAWDENSDGHFAFVADNPLTLRRDSLGLAPLYYGHTVDGTLCFASEVKALLVATHDVHEAPCGHSGNGECFERYYHLAPQTPINETPETLARELRRCLGIAVEKHIGEGPVGSWLSGGLDSSLIAALARPYVPTLHTFAVGTKGAPDLRFAREVATFIRSDHHEIVVTLEDMLAALPEVIYFLESFDALLVRSSITNYLAARRAAGYVPAVFSGEGGDELFAGYEYLKAVPLEHLAEELIDITGRLHNTALQRVDRCAAAHGCVAYVPFLEPEVVYYALRIPVEFKLQGGVEKWILRQAAAGLLPKSVLKRPKAKFWQGAGVGEQLAQYAQEHISDPDFVQERQLPNGWQVNTKEELLYYRIFRQHFGPVEDLSWMGRTKGAPVI